MSFRFHRPSRNRGAKDQVARVFGLLGLASVLCGFVLAPSGLGARSAAPTESADAEAIAAHNKLLRRTCVRCHNDADQTGGLTLESFAVQAAHRDVEVAEKVIRKLRTGMMPPPPFRRPPAEQIEAVLTFLETTVDLHAAADPDPGSRPFQRLNRAEYRRAVRDLLVLDVDVEAFLPPDTISHGFDNVADVQTLSPTLMEGYLRAAASIADQALGTLDATPRQVTYPVPRTASQRERVEGAPFGTRGGVAVEHVFPADGLYSFQAILHSTPTGQLFGSTAEGEALEISIDGRRIALLEIDRMMDESDPTGMQLQTEPFFVRGGVHTVSAAFLEHGIGPLDDLIAPIEHTLADTQIGLDVGITTVPHLRSFTIGGPFQATGLAASPSRRRIFSCRPTSRSEELPCAEQIVRSVATQAYRRELSAEDLEGLMHFYLEGAQRTEESVGGFENGIRVALQAILASPHFLFRLEQIGDPAEEGEPGGAYRISDVDLASRLSFFLWGSVPDEELRELAAQQRLGAAEVLTAQVDRMLADRRSEALATRFAAQWLRLQDLDQIHPDALSYANFDQTLAAAMRRETVEFFDDLVRRDGSILRLLDADYTFVNERLARHYGLANVSGEHFRRVPLPDERRRGLLGHGSILTLTSHANRTSPVLRGKWVMEVLLGSPPPPPPPDVPELEVTAAKDGDRVLTVRERLEEHRSNPACMSCHRVIDPIGLALENFDVTGAWRTKDAGAPVDTSGQLYDGTELNGPSDLRLALLDHSDAVALTFAENLLAYATGRRLEASDMTLVREVVKRAEHEGMRISAFVHGVVQSPAFRMRRDDEEQPPSSTSTSVGR